VQAAHSPKTCIFSFPKHKATASRPYQKATGQTTGAKLTARPLETSPQAQSWQRSDLIPVQAVPIRKQPDKPQAQSSQPNHWKPAHRRKIGSVSEPLPVQAAHNLKP